VAKNKGSPAEAAADAAALLDGWEADLEGLVERGAIRGLLSGWANVGHSRILVRYWLAREAGQDDEHAKATSGYSQSISLFDEYTEALAQGDERRTRAGEKLSRLWNLPIPEQIKTSTEHR
jgi:hypothetical protein